VEHLNDRPVGVGGDERVDSGSEIVAILEELVEDKGGDDELDDDKANTGTKVTWLA